MLILNGQLSLTLSCLAQNRPGPSLAPPRSPLFRQSSVSRIAQLPLACYRSSDPGAYGRDKQWRQAEKERDKEAREAWREAEKDRREAEREWLKDQREAEREWLKAEQEAQREWEKDRREVEREWKKDRREARKHGRHPRLPLRPALLK